MNPAHSAAWYGPDHGEPGDVELQGGSAPHRQRAARGVLEHLIAETADQTGDDEPHECLTFTSNPQSTG